MAATSSTSASGQSRKNRAFCGRAGVRLAEQSAGGKRKRTRIRNETFSVIWISAEGGFMVNDIRLAGRPVRRLRSLLPLGIPM